MKKKILIILIILIGLGAAGGVYWYKEVKTRWIAMPTLTPSAKQHFPGWAPSDLGLAISPDGKTAFIPFSLDDALLVVSLSTFTVIDSINVSAAGNMLFSNNAVLTPDGKKLYVANAGTRNMMVIGTENKTVEKVLPIKALWAVTTAMSQDGSKAYIPSEDGGLYIINTSDDSYRQIFIPGIIFGPVVPSRKNPDILYVVGVLMEPAGIPKPSFFTFNLSSNTVVRSSNLTNEVMPPNMFTRRFVVNSDETRAYFGWFHMDDRGTGNFNIFDIDNFKVLSSTPMDNGVTDFAVNEKTSKIYIVGFWAGGGAPQELPIIEYDITTNKITRRIMMSPSSDQRAIALDPTNENYLYMTEGDFNLIRKVDILAGKEINKLYFNKADIRPYAIIRGDNDIGYVVSGSSEKIYKLDLRSGQLIGNIQLPDGASYAGGYYQGKLYFSGGNYIYSIDPFTGSLIKKFDIGTNINTIILTFFNDKMATIDFAENGMTGRRLLFFDARNMSIIKSIELPREPHGDKVIVSPDGSKLYTVRGPMMGAPTGITIFNSSNLEIINTIEIPAANLRHGATGFVEADFDKTNRILYLTGFESVYKIGMDTDKLIGIIDMIDAYELQNIGGWSPTGLCGVVLSQEKDKMFIVSGDAHSVYTYDINKSSWSTKITNLGGYFITDALSSSDRHYLYTVNQKSDSITMVDLTSGDVVKIIELQK